MSQYRSEVCVPSHDELTEMWSSTVEAYKDDVAALIVPENGSIITMALPHTTPEMTIGEALMRAVDTAVASEILHGPSKWLAVAAPAFVEDPTSDRRDIARGQLQQEYMAGADNIRQVLVVLSMEFGSPPTGTVYVQPLLEVLHPTAQIGVDGLTFSMFMALCTLNVP